MNNGWKQDLLQFLSGEHPAVIRELMKMPYAQFTNKDETITWDVDRLNDDADKGVFGNLWRVDCPPAKPDYFYSLDHIYLAELVDKAMVAARLWGEPWLAFEPCLWLSSGTAEDGRNVITEILDGNHRLGALQYIKSPFVHVYIVPPELEKNYRLDPEWGRVIARCYDAVQGRVPQEEFKKLWNQWRQKIITAHDQQPVLPL